MKTPAKVWLWIVFIANILTALTYIRLLMTSALYGVLLVLSLLMAAAVGVLLFKRRKLGYYFICGLAVIAFFVNVSMHVNFIFALLAMILGPLITYLFIKSSWDYLL